MNGPSSENKKTKRRHYQNRQQSEIHRRFMTLQSKRHQLEHELRTINALLLSLGNQMAQDFAYKQMYK